jgi:hypothetical protein
MITTKNQAARVLAVLFALSLASTYVVRSQWQQNRYVASSSKSLSSVVSAVPGGSTAAPGAPTSISKTNAINLSGLRAVSTGLVARISSTNGIPTVSTVPSQMLFPGSKSAPVFDFQSTSLVALAKQTGSVVSSNSRAMKR